MDASAECRKQGQYVPAAEAVSPDEYARHIIPVRCNEEVDENRAKYFKGFDFPVFGPVPLSTILCPHLQYDEILGDPYEVLSLAYRCTTPRILGTDIDQLAFVLGIALEFNTADICRFESINGINVVIVAEPELDQGNTQFPAIFTWLHDILDGLLNWWQRTRGMNQGHPEIPAFENPHVFLNTISGMIATSSIDDNLKKYITKAINLQCSKHDIVPVVPMTLWESWFVARQQALPYPNPTHLPVVHRWVLNQIVRTVVEFDGNTRPPHANRGGLDEFSFAVVVEHFAESRGYSWLKYFIMNSVAARTVMLDFTKPAEPYSRKTTETRPALLQRIITNLQAYAAEPVGPHFAVRFYVGSYMLLNVTSALEEAYLQPLVDVSRVFMRYEHNFTLDLSDWVAELGHKRAISRWGDVVKLSNLITILLRFLDPHPDALFTLRDDFLADLGYSDLEAIKTNVWMNPHLPGVEWAQACIQHKVVNTKQLIALIGFVMEVGEFYTVLYRARVRPAAFKELIEYMDAVGMHTQNPQNTFPLSNIPVIHPAEFPLFLQTLARETITMGSFAQLVTDEQRKFLAHPEYRNLWTDKDYTEPPDLDAAWKYATVHLALALLPFAFNFAARGTTYSEFPPLDPLDVHEDEQKRLKLESHANAPGVMYQDEHTLGNVAHRSRDDSVKLQARLGDDGLFTNDGEFSSDESDGLQ